MKRVKRFYIPGNQMQLYPNQIEWCSFESQLEVGRHIRLVDFASAYLRSCFENGCLLRNLAVPETYKMSVIHYDKSFTTKISMAPSHFF